MTNKHIDNLEIHMDKKFANLEGKTNMKFGEVNKRIDGLENKMDAKFAEQKEDIIALTKVVNKIAAKIL